eukprot:TRINITY_DN9955_c0_g1_i1.p1 TRINITY_DN9955_c0_g1~~TRINITY_DN9955_c0_g1_i1.p1  ORF type:complete len:1062 (+),score=163.51 TRINITY_DN9955_c0_g1_i1:219-3404(+)
MVLAEACGAVFCHGASNAADISNSLFGSVVAVTGDAHQAQVAQDIFRQEVRIERSLRIREDIRDAHKLMIENVQTQLLMGNIVLGICFMVLIEGKPSDPILEPVLVQEMWAVFTVWAVSLSFLSVWFALQFQEVVSLSARKRLLEKHRVCTPNDEVVGRMGGGNIAEKVSQLHQGGLNRLSGFLAANSLYESVKAACHDGVDGKTAEAGDVHMAANDLADIKSSMPKSPALPVLAPSQPCIGSHFHRYSDSELPDLNVKVSFDGSSPSIIKSVERRDGRAFRRQWSLGEPVAVRACRGTRAWFDEDHQDLSSQYVADLPDFLVDETLIRCNWYMPEPKLRRSVRIAVQGEATLYVSALWTKSGDFLGVHGPPADWNPEEIPLLRGGADFQRVEGFSVLLSGRKFELPVYRAVLAKPDSSGWCNAKLTWRFKDSFEAPLIILRKGRVLTSEEDWPVREFLNELDAIQPLREHSMRYMGYGLTNLFCAAFLAHLGRILTDRPWPQCSRELAIILCAFLPALTFSFQSEALMRWLFNLKLPRHLMDLAAHTTASHEPTTPRAKTSQWKSIEADNDSRNTSPRYNADSSPQGKPGLNAKNSYLQGLSSLGHSGFPASAFASQVSQAVSPESAEAAKQLEYMCEQCAGSGLEFASCLSQAQATLDAQEFVVVADPQKKQLWYSETKISTTAESTHKQQADLELGQEGALPIAADDDSLSNVDLDRPKRRACWVVLGEARFRRRLLSCMDNYPQMNRINLFLMVVQLLWFSSIVGLFLSRTLPSLQGWGLAPIALRSSSLHWVVQEVSWPAPFFEPTAAAFAPDGSLWVASDWLLTRLEGERSAAWRLPVAAKGVLLPSTADGRYGLVIASDSLLIPLTLPGNGSKVPANSLGSLQLSKALLATEPSLQIPVDQVGAITAATAGRLPGVETDIVSVALKDGSVAICAPQQLLQNRSTPHASRRLQVAAKVPRVHASVTVPGSSTSSNGSSAALQALFLCADLKGSCGSVLEPVLWVLESTGCLLATGLESGKALGRWRVSRDRPESKQRAVLAGNATHLVVIAASLA